MATLLAVGREYPYYEGPTPINGRVWNLSARTAGNHRPHPGRGQISVVAAGIWLAMALATGVSLAVEFPGPTVLPQDGASLAVAKVRLPGADRDYFATGSGGGFLNLSRYDLSSEYFTVLQRQFVGGEVSGIVPWLGPGAPAVGLIVATTNPDRLLFVQVSDGFPYYDILAEIDLSEDPGGLAFVGDVAGDDVQLAVALPGIDQIVLLAHLGGAWTLAAEIPTGDTPASLVGVDLDGDGVRELIAAQAGALSQTLGVFRRQPDGSYPLETVTLPGISPALVDAFDLDGDGRRELAVAGASEPTIVFYSEIDGVLVETSRAALAIPARAMHLGALPEGAPGLFVASDERGLLEFASFIGGQWLHEETIYPGCRPLDFALVDMDGDEVDDLISVGGAASILTTMLGDNEPGFAGWPAFSLDRNPGSFVSADIDGDGWRDLLLSDANKKSISLTRGQPGGALGPAWQTLDLGFIPGFILAANMDQDPALELAVLDIVAEELVVVDLEGSSLIPLSRSAVGDFPYFIAAGDLDGDQAMDLMVLSQDVPEVAVLYGAGDGGVDEIANLGFEYSAHWIRPIDLNGDGLPDLAAADASSRIGVLLNQGGRQFGEESVRNAGRGVLQMVTGDLDGDFDLDLVVANRNENSLSFFENDGSGSLVTRILKHPLPGQPAGIVLEDFDRDGQLDVLVNLKNAELLGIVFGLTSWSYSPALQVPGGPEMVGLDTSDFNQDGVPDILVLDRLLMLGLVLLNEDPGQVAVAPSALAAECLGTVFELRIRPDRPGPWRVELKRDQVWQTVMANGRSSVGEGEFSGETWLLRLSAAVLAEWGHGAARELDVRLSVGEGAAREMETRTFALDCGQRTTVVLPRLAWQREPWPNPFNPAVKADIVMRRAGPLRVGVYDLAGRELATLASGNFPAGVVAVHWDGIASGRPVGAGVYLLRAETPGGLIQRKVILVK